MKSKEIDLREYASGIIIKRAAEIIPSEVKGFGDYDGAGIVYQDYDVVGRDRIRKTVSISDILDIKVEVIRIKQEINYLVDIKPYNDSINVFCVSNTAEEAFAVKDRLDEMIENFKETMKGESHEPNYETT